MDLDRYRAAREGAVFFDEPDRGRILAVGADRASYLQGLLTNDIHALGPGTGCYAAYLTAQGRMISDMYVMELGDAILVDMPASAREEVTAKFARFLFSEDVQLGDTTETFNQLSLVGPKSAAVLASTLSDPDAGALASFVPHQNARFDFEGERMIAARRDDYGVTGFVAYVPGVSDAAFRRALEAAGAARAERDVAETLRVEAGRPLFGVDMDADTIPLEAGIEDRAISFSKGCYVGQEVIVRVLHRGHGRVARKLVGLRIDGDVPARGDAIVSGDKRVGQITSAARSPAVGAPIALGYVQRDFVAPGTAVAVSHEGQTIAATVVEVPFVR